MVDYGVSGSVALLGINHPPVNSIGTSVKNGLMDGVKKANSDPNVKAIMVYGQGRMFAAGADITGFEGKRNAKVTESDKMKFIRMIEQSQKPVVAAIHGVALGGGMETALACHYRVLHKNAQLGLPEVDLGILPGWGGTQRFPRIAGLKVALDVIAFGRRLGSKEATDLGAVDKVVEGDMLQEGLRFTESIIGKPLDDRIISHRPVKDAAQAQELVDAALKKAKQKKNGLMAPIFCIQAVHASVLHPFEEGLKEEERCLHFLFASGQAKALQYAFLGERMATKCQMDGMDPSKVRPMSVKSAGIVGAGTMGTGITMSILNAGIPVTLLEQNQKFLDRGVSSLRHLYDGSVSLGRMSREQADALLASLTPTTEYETLANVDVVIEAIYENIEPKKQVFKKLDSVCKPSTMLFSNTSFLDIDQLASATKRPKQVMGTHFFAPAYYMKLLENVKGDKTGPETIATAMDLGRKIGKVPVLVGNCHGFVGNRMQGPYRGEATYMLEEGLLPWDVDAVIEDFGFPLGPFKVADLAGLDVGFRGRQDYFKSLGLTLDDSVKEVAGVRYSAVQDIICRKERYGRKTGKGWYRYEKPGTKEPYSDDEVIQLIEKHRRDHGLQPRNVSKQEILERCLYSLINEGFKVLEEGIASKPQVVDTIWLLGYGWPRYTGGPLFYASQVGLKNILERIRNYNKLFHNVPHWQPSALLEKLAAVHTPGMPVDKAMATAARL